MTTEMLPAAPRRRRPERSRRVLDEYQTAVVELPDDALRDLVQLAEDRIGISVGPRPGTWVLKATQHVGTIVTPEIEILVRPKIPLENLFLLLDVELPLVTWGRQLFGYGQADDVLAAFAELFARSVDHTLRAGVLRSYVEQRERETALRGRVDIPGLMRVAGLATPVPCRYDELSADIPENRYVKAAARRLLHVPGVQSGSRALLRRSLALLEDVTDTSPRPEDLDRIHLSRLSRYYGTTLRLARLVLANLGLIDRAGENDAASFMLDMNDLFQDWVTQRLRRALRGRLSVESEPRIPLGQRNLVPMYPDLVFKRGTALAAIGDVKYKLTDSGLGRAGDYYQLLAYATATGLPGGVLVYCQDTGETPPRELTVRRGGQILHTFALDLQGGKQQIEGSIAGLADFIELSALPRSA